MATGGTPHEPKEFLYGEDPRVVTQLEFETQLISDGADGLVTRHRVSPYQIEAAGRPLHALNDETVAAMTGALRTAPKSFVEVDITHGTSSR